MRTTRIDAAETARLGLVAWASDDLRLPLDELRSLVEDAVAAAGDDPASEHRSRRMLRQIGRLSEVLDDLVALAGGEAQPRPWQPVGGAEHVDRRSRPNRLPHPAASSLTVPNAGSDGRGDAQIFDLAYQRQQVAG